MKNLLLTLILLSSIIFLTNLTSANTLTLLCLEDGDEVLFSKCNPIIPDRTCEATICTLCVTEIRPGVYCPANFNKCNSEGLTCENPTPSDVSNNEEEDDEIPEDEDDNTDNNTEKNTPKITINSNNNDADNLDTTFILDENNENEDQEKTNTETTNFNPTNNPTKKPASLFLFSFMAITILEIIVLSGLLYYSKTKTVKPKKKSLKKKK